MLNYQHQTCSQTLQQGIDEYEQAYRGQLSSRELSPEGKTFFNSHDVVHVVFGCDLSLPDEMIVKISSFFGTTGGADVLRGYRLPESKEIYAELDVTEIVTTTVKAFVLVPRTILRCHRMSQRWPWHEFDSYLDTPLDEIRGQFKIKVAH